jgi:hypothetical protein
LLESLKKAYTKGLFDSLEPANKLPVSIDVINSYLKILKPAYLVNIYLQRNSSCIAEVIPLVLKLINNWELLLRQYNVSKSCKIFCKYLIDEFKRRFNYELESELYQVYFYFIFIFKLSKYSK